MTQELLQGSGASCMACLCVSVDAFYKRQDVVRSHLPQNCVRTSGPYHVNKLARSRIRPRPISGFLRVDLVARYGSRFELIGLFDMEEARAVGDSAKGVS